MRKFSLSAADITHRGFIGVDTRSKWRKPYANFKKSTLTVSKTVISYLTLKQFGTIENTLKRYKYQALALMIFDLVVVASVN